VGGGERQETKRQRADKNVYPTILEWTACYGMTLFSG